MAQIGNEPTRIDGVKPARDQCREHDEGGTVVIVGVAGNDDLRTLKPSPIRSECMIGVFVELKFIPRLAVIGQRDQASYQNDNQQGEDGELLGTEELFH